MSKLTYEDWIKKEEGGRTRALAEFWQTDFNNRVLDGPPEGLNNASRKSWPQGIDNWELLTIEERAVQQLNLRIDRLLQKLETTWEDTVAMRDQAEIKKSKAEQELANLATDRKA
jgi:hypothetical protein